MGYCKECVLPDVAPFNRVCETTPRYRQEDESLNGLQRARRQWASRKSEITATGAMVTMLRRDSGEEARCVIDTNDGKESMREQRNIRGYSSGVPATGTGRWSDGVLHDESNHRIPSLLVHSTNSANCVPVYGI